MQPDHPESILSPREYQLLRLAAAGYTDMAIAEQLGISEATVGTYWGRVRIKFGPYSRTELVAIMMRAESNAAYESLRLEKAEELENLQLKLTSGGAISPRLLLESSPDAIVLVSANGFIEFANQAAHDLFGYFGSEMEGLSHSALIPLRYRDKHDELSTGFLKEPARKRMGLHLETPAVNKLGDEFPICASISAVESSDGPIVMCVVRAA